MTEEIVKIEEVNGQSLYLAEKASVDIQVSTARAFPRNIRRAVDNAMAIITMDQETAKTCTYAVPRAGKSITGPSVHMAKILVQCWGNIRIEARVVDIDVKHVTSEAVCWDLETNVAIKAQVKRSVMTRNGRMSDDMITVTGNAANSIALRNAVYSVIPKSVINKAYDAAISTITGDLSDETKLIAKRKKVVDGLKDAYNVTEEEVLSSIGKVSIQHIKAEDIAILIGIGTAIKDGDTTIEEAFRGKTARVKADPEKVSRQKQLDRLKEELAKATEADELDILEARVIEDAEMSKMVAERKKELQSAKK
jgi:hypothetical protein